MWPLCFSGEMLVEGNRGYEQTPSAKEETAPYCQVKVYFYCYPPLKDENVFTSQFVGLLANQC